MEYRGDGQKSGKRNGEHSECSNRGLKTEAVCAQLAPFRGHQHLYKCTVALEGPVQSRLGPGFYSNLLLL